MEVSSAALNPNLLPAPNTRQNEVDLECSSSGPAVVLPSKLDVIGSYLLKFPQEGVLNRTIARHDWDTRFFRGPFVEGRT